jgi:hypothetical protein
MLKTIPQIRHQFHTVFPSDQAIYRAVREKIVPPGIAVRIGRRLLIDSEKLQTFFDNGGSALPGGWKREAE